MLEPHEIDEAIALIQAEREVQMDSELALQRLGEAARRRRAKREKETAVREALEAIILHQANTLTAASTTGAGPPTANTTIKRERAELELAAIAALATIGPCCARIAKKIGVPRSTLMGWATFREHYDRAKSHVEIRKHARRGKRAGQSDYTLND